MESRELEIEAPWGKIAAKVWGQPDKQLVIAVHGLMDTAGTFDRLMPLLPDLFYVCIDLPGHGRSSHFPPHLQIFSIHFLTVYPIILKYFKREKCIIMGHSYGGQIGQLFAQLYPERVEKLIMLESVHLFTVAPKYFKNILLGKLNLFLSIEEKQKQRSAPVYTYDQVVDRIIEGRKPWAASPLPSEAAKVLLERRVTPVGNNQYQFSSDQRMKCVISPLNSSEYVVETLKTSPITCPVLIVFGRDNTLPRRQLKPILDYYETQKNFEIKYLPGDHDIHITDAESVARLVSEFLTREKSKL